MTKFGAFARLQDDIEGLIHISEISENRIEHPKEVLKEGEVVTVRVIKIDPENHRVGLSVRRVDSSAYVDLDWQSLVTEMSSDGLVETNAQEEPVVSQTLEPPAVTESTGSKVKSKSPRKSAKPKTQVEEEPAVSESVSENPEIPAEPKTQVEEEPAVSESVSENPEIPAEPKTQVEEEPAVSESVSENPEIPAEPETPDTPSEESESKPD